MNEDEETGYYTQVDHVLTNVKNQWAYVEKTVSVPANIDKLNLRVGLQYGSVGQSVWFDDVKIEVTGANENEILDEKNYYPFGLEHKGYNSNVVGVENNYQTYNGQELNKDLGLNVVEMTYRKYDPAIGRFNVIDAAAEMARNWTPYRFAFNNPVLFSDPTGLWEIKNGQWYTNDKKDIERFLNMLAFEEMNTGEGASIAQIDQFIGEEFRGSGGRLSNGSILLDSQIIMGDSNGNSNGFSARQKWEIVVLPIY